MGKLKIKWVKVATKHIARDVARATDIPYETALIIVNITAKMMQVKLKSTLHTTRKMRIKNFGMFRISQIIHNAKGPYRRISFTPCPALSVIMSNPPKFKNFKYEIEQARKIRRLLLAGYKMKALRYARVLRLRLINKPLCVEFMRVRNIWPPSVWLPLDK